MPRQRRRYIGAPITMLLLVTACTSADGEETQNDDVSPISKILGVESLGSAEEQSARFAEQEQKREETVARCMGEQGFDYTPRDTSKDSEVFDGDEEGLDPLSREWAAKYGMGVSTQWYSQNQVGPELLGYAVETEPDDEEQEPDDPNTEYYDRLDESTQRAYYAALYGPAVAIDESLTEEELFAQLEAAEPAGCHAVAQDEVGNDFDKLEDFHDQFGDELDELYQAATNDPRVVEGYREINDCMVGKGLDPISPGPHSSGGFPERMGELDELVQADLRADPPDDQRASEDGEGQLATGQQDADESDLLEPELSDEVKMKLAAIQKEEIEYAVIALDCGALTQPEVLREVIHEYEERFVSDNADELEAWQNASGS